MSIQVDFTKGYPTAEAERGKFVVIDPSTITDLPSGSRGRYALLVYNVNGGDVEVDIPTLTGVDIKSTNITNNLTTITFDQPVQRVEIFNTNPASIVYLSLVSSAVSTFAQLTSTAMPVERFYSADFETSSIAIGATEASDVRIIGHF